MAILDKQRLRYKTGIVMTQEPFYKNYERCCQHLEKGILVEKYNYHNDQHRACTLRLVNGRTQLAYDNVDQPETNGLMTFLRPTSKINLSAVLGVIYGGYTSTFKR